MKTTHRSKQNQQSIVNVQSSHIFTNKLRYKVCYIQAIRQNFAELPFEQFDLVYSILKLNCKL